MMAFTGVSDPDASLDDGETDAPGNLSGIFGQVGAWDYIELYHDKS